MKRKRLHSFTVWQGASEIDGAPIALLVMRGSKNVKTGALIQTYILRTDLSPTETLKQGLDGCICGKCIHSSKGNGGQGTCYVRVDTGPLNVWKAFQRGKYPLIGVSESREQVAGLKVRLGTYGDPCAVPQWVWRGLLANVAGCTGYTHGWKEARYAWLKSYAMASCDSHEETIEARRNGWRTFTVIPKQAGPVHHGADTLSVWLATARERGARRAFISQCMG